MGYADWSLKDFFDLRRDFMEAGLSSAGVNFCVWMKNMNKENLNISVGSEHYYHNVQN